jgi:hypothetical protein
MPAKAGIQKNVVHLHRSIPDRAFRASGMTR